ncbi:hypothetical protein C9I89_13560 [Photobacterium lipolyticum]|uniref:Uncharacterized protein n=1 Tax=Photobacterium lipolyticum TaxID=266810 RepID=A0A2T3MWY4_9GAMM|nr:hypothetical protein C9I89_13560 [Photobacterium lipolyticum]
MSLAYRNQTICARSDDASEIQPQYSFHILVTKLFIETDYPLASKLSDSAQNNLVHAGKAIGAKLVFHGTKKY